jgi:2-phosphosulfolactate phosphatase
MSQRQLNVYYLPRFVTDEELAGSAVVVLDVLRASTTICQALASGASEVVPFLEVGEALRAAAAADPKRNEIVLGGERHGRRIAGFDLGNSPSEYTREAVGGRRVFITTTNGTRALERARLAKRVLIGAAVNLSAVAASLRNEARVDLICAGTDGLETGEDILVAGAIADRICGRSGTDGQFNLPAASALLLWKQLADSGPSLNERLADAFRDTPGGRNLLEIGLDADLVDCAQVDRLDVVPELDLSTWRIRLV